MADHDHGKVHGHSHSHGHVHAPEYFGRAFAIGIGLNILFASAEAGAGLWFGSMALLADAGHNFSDVLGLIIAWVGSSLARRPATPRFTWGLRGSTILASLANALLLMLALGAIMLEAIGRLLDPADAPAPGGAMVAIATIGVAVNLATALLFVRGSKQDLNIRGAYLHMAADAGVSAGVVVAGLLILSTGQNWIDPAVSLLIAFIILWNSWGLLKQSIFMFLGAVPEGIETAEVESLLAELPGVEAVHDLHIWPMGTRETVLTAHLVMDSHPGNAFLLEAQDRLKHKFGIGHATLQIELGESPCSDCG